MSSNDPHGSSPGPNTPSRKILIPKKLLSPHYTPSTDQPISKQPQSDAAKNSDFPATTPTETPWEFPNQKRRKTQADAKGEITLEEEKYDGHDLYGLSPGGKVGQAKEEERKKLGGAKVEGGTGGGDGDAQGNGESRGVGRGRWSYGVLRRSIVWECVVDFLADQRKYAAGGPFMLVQILEWW
ncbi:hypothetical protein EJ08DRAFT_333236 [Tothia fuscella]|uniref:Uncharacterized protein n=1 Tax=Tothia fuscella TaxID=1048955 RepID=A0A9P4TVN4_9PEZI|nr:hypothetical protein EJ08DRAFT_333236 [Tothia fuscella]